MRKEGERDWTLCCSEWTGERWKARAGGGGGGDGAPRFLRHSECCILFSFLFLHKINPALANKTALLSEVCPFKGKKSTQRCGDEMGVCLSFLALAVVALGSRSLLLGQQHSQCIGQLVVVCFLNTVCVWGAELPFVSCFSFFHFSCSLVLCLSLHFFFDVSSTVIAPYFFAGFSSLDFRVAGRRV